MRRPVESIVCLVSECQILERIYIIRVFTANALSEEDDRFELCLPFLQNMKSLAEKEYRIE